MPIFQHCYLFLICSLILSGSAQTDIHLRIVTENQIPFINYTYGLPGNDRFDGFAKDLINLVIQEVKSYKITYDLFLTPDGKVGSREPDGSWNGMIGEIIKGNADLALSGLTVTSGRYKVVDFTLPFLDVGLSIMVKQAEPKPDLWVFLRPFSIRLWIALFCVSFSFSILTWVMDKITPYGMTHERKKLLRLDGDELPEPYTYSDALFGSLLLFIGKDPEPARSWGIRLVIIAFMTFAVITMANYTATLTTFFTVKKLTDTPVNGLEDLARLPFGIIGSTATEEFFKRPSNRRFAKNMKTFDNIDDLDAALDSGEILAIIDDDVLLEFRTNQGDCSTFLVGELFDKSNYALAYPRNSSKVTAALIREINRGILTLREKGQLEALFHSWWNEGYCENRGNQVVNQSLKVQDFLGVFYLVAILSGAGFLLLGLELGFYAIFKRVDSPGVVLRSMDAFLGGKVKLSRTQGGFERS